MDKQEQSRKMIEKQFALSEVPIKNWLLKCLVLLDIRGQCESSTEFTDCVLTEYKDKYYKISLTHEKKAGQKTFFEVIPKDKFIEHDTLKEAVGMFFNAVNLVYIPVLRSFIINDDSIFDNVFPKFDNDELSFSLVAANKKLTEKAMLEQNITLISKQIDRAKSVMDRTINQLFEQRLKHMAEYNAITDDDIAQAQIVSEKKTLKLSVLPKLYVNIEVSNSTDTEALTKRIDIFSTQYEDID